ncbi:C-X-C motif chemokine 13 [Xenopus laevis]|uniref:C-X-C motif chemokine 13 n=2 Tax=Xenopus laevis TaxID=8355 RepID=A0A1L8HVE2_XENLA|nr:C-X-C motif chemokine 13 [Xenopus laevis]XP_018108240.1 C-X-C motif chemokine 13 [Xenopus laevis]XP_018108248.1 C-X-C motif chemokine 13 [Xenopus laevis]XP_018108256.1 C-X-C motif chemokine 13 [Xenopus laevis]XP_018108265.1 C-X-C motif chemokine 13 [Xenopus laevis]XP_018108274.1 C-X-C motif chemokine 13 [Xenopus laevis]XP_018108288.1 C-X-C motif chemokine 13 [Xenopus laevis]OCU00080.1 hypothetical protein XELAEV_18005864mg [Xenopus laevis]
MSMKHIAVLSVIVLLAILHCIAGSLEPRLPGGRCKCFKQTNQFIKPNKLTRVEFFPPGRSCPQLECLVTLKNGEIVCVNPQAVWLQRLIAYLKEKSSAADSTPI